jgi:uncharacterized membrane protein
MTKRMIVGLLALVGVFVSVYLTLYKLGYIGQLNCAVGSCETVNTSRWATFLGLPVAAWGLGFYLVVFAVAMVAVQERYEDSKTLSLVLAGLTGWGVLFSGWLTYLELFVIDAICIWCVTSAIIVLVMFAVCLADLREFRGAADVENELVGQSSSRATPHAKSVMSK